MTPQTIADLRAAIRRRDEEIVRLLNERADLAVEIGRVKNSQGLDIYDPAQESRVLETLKDMSTGPLPEKGLREIYREIFSASRSLQAPLTVACLGPEGSWSHLATLAQFGKSMGIVTVKTIGHVFDAVERGSNDCGVVPVENSLEGSIKLTLDRLTKTPLKIRAEIFHRISYCLITTCAAKTDIRRIYSHPQGLAQCQGWIAKHLPEAVHVDTDSTADAVLKAKADPEGAAAASSLAAELYQVPVLERAIEDSPMNTTRFLVIGQGAGEPTGRDKTSILFATPHAPGALYAALEPFASDKINLIRIESYPARDRLWEYLFFVDMEGHTDDAMVKDCLAHLEAKTVFLRVMGSYPRGEEAS